MKLGLSVCMMGLLAGCVAAKPEASPHMQEGGPVTNVVTLHGWQDGSDIWRADVMRPKAGAPGDIKVFGPDNDLRAAFFASKACIEHGGQFNPAVVAVERPLPDAGVTLFTFAEACL